MNKKQLQSLLNKTFPNKEYKYQEEKHFYKGMVFSIRETFHFIRLIIWRRENIEASAIFCLGEPMFEKVRIRLL